ncbi:MAG TPA: hypothetical protein VEY07_03565 [Thermoplasmata archaeon]|nr:hypothetical protein [Thermoplasmata archaeon]
MRDAAHEVKRIATRVVQEAKPMAKKAVAVGKGAVRGAVQGLREPGASPPPPPTPPPPGATGDLPSKKPDRAASEGKS